MGGLRSLSCSCGLRGWTWMSVDEEADRVARLKLLKLLEYLKPLKPFLNMSGPPQAFQASRASRFFLSSSSTLKHHQLLQLRKPPLNPLEPSKLLGPLKPLKALLDHSRSDQPSEIRLTFMSFPFLFCPPRLRLQ